MLLAVETTVLMLQINSVRIMHGHLGNHVRVHDIILRMSSRVERQTNKQTDMKIAIEPVVCTARTWLVTFSY